MNINKQSHIDENKDLKPFSNEETISKISKEQKKTEKNELKNNKDIKTTKNLDRATLSQSIMLGDYQIDNIIHKKLDYKLPVKLKSPEYFRLLDTIKKELDHAQREVNSNKIDKALSMSELALYYLNNINI